MKKQVDISVLPGGVMLLTLKEVEQALQVKTTTVYELIKKGQLRVVKVGRSTRFLPSDIKEFILNHLY
jgi:excisionase family DNA binding protein